jgi:hypothetical protein
MLARHQSMDPSPETTWITHLGAENSLQTMIHHPQILTMEFLAAFLVLLC